MLITKGSFQNQFFKTIMRFVVIIGCVLANVLHSAALAQTPMVFQREYQLQTSKLDRNNNSHLWAILLPDSTWVGVTSPLDKRGSVFYLNVEKPVLRTLSPRETLRVDRMDKFEPKLYIGSPTDTCWLFNVTLGPIELLSPIAEDNLSFAVAFKTPSGEKITLTRSNLEMIITNPSKRVNAALSSGKLWKAVVLYNEEYARGKRSK
jgi:hypothetical protein